MTQQRRDNHSTEFGIWLRQQPEIDSSYGFLATNIDYMWTNYKTGEWMLLEEKRYNTPPKEWQKRCFEVLHSSIKHDKYKGFHYLTFEKTTPEDGKMWLDCRLITKNELLSFLRFGK